jgi:hypothetical protein
VRVFDADREFGGFLIDVSLNGLAFEYVFLDEPLKEGHRIDICSGKDDLCVENLPFKVVFDVQMNDPEPEPVTWRRAGIQFTNLSDVQKRQLAELIRCWGYPVDSEGPPATCQDAEGKLGNEIFLSRIKLLNIAAKAYLGGYPYGIYREAAITRNARAILDHLPGQKVLRFGETHSPLLEKHISRLAAGFSVFPVKSHGSLSLEESIDYVSEHLRVDKNLTKMAFLKVA